jgi:hypothetical protein
VGETFGTSGELETSHLKRVRVSGQRRGCAGGGDVRCTFAEAKHDELAKTQEEEALRASYQVRNGK